MLFRSGPSNERGRASGRASGRAPNRGATRESGRAGAGRALLRHSGRSSDWSGRDGPERQSGRLLPGAGASTRPRLGRGADPSKLRAGRAGRSPCHGVPESRGRSVDGPRSANAGRASEVSRRTGGRPGSLVRRGRSETEGRSPATSRRGPRSLRSLRPPRSAPLATGRGPRSRGESFRERAGPRLGPDRAVMCAAFATGAGALARTSATSARTTSASDDSTSTPRRRNIAAEPRSCSFRNMLTTTPSAPARAVRPERWM